MKRVLSVLCAAALCLVVNAKKSSDMYDGGNMVSTTDPAYEWSQFKNKKTSVLATAKGLSLVNKEADRRVASVIELPFNYESDSFMFGAMFNGPKLTDDVQVGIIFDYADDRNYKGVKISKDQYSYFMVKEGVESSIKTGLIKFKGKDYLLTINKSGDKMEFSLNGVEFSRLKRITIDNPYFGVLLQGKGQTLVPKFVFEVEQNEDIEQSTTDM